MNLLIVVTLCTFLSSVQSFDHPKWDDNRRIVKGQISVLLPFMVHLSIKRKKEPINCGASLLTPNGAVTAAHCIEGAQSIKAFFGSEKAFSGETRNAKSWLGHKKFDSATKVYDIGVVVWKDAISFSETISPISIGPHPPVGTEIEAAGFGDTSIGKHSDILRKMKAPLKDNKYCEKEKVHVESFFKTAPKDSYLCIDEDPYKGICSGDSGGPVFLNRMKPILIGVVSLGPADCASGGNIYTSANYFNKWIQGAIKCLVELKQENQQGKCNIS